MNQAAARDPRFSLVTSFLWRPVVPTNLNLTTRAGRRVAVLAVSALGATALAAPIAQADIGVPNSGIGLHGPVIERYGFFPEYYQDGNGTRLQLCIDLAATCGAIATPNGGPVSFPNNFPDEAFYWSAGASAGNTNFTLAQEATFDGTDGNQAVFGRMRIRNGGGDLTAGQRYRITTPYGQLELVAGAGGVINDTADVGCGPAIGAVCDSAAAFSAPGGSVIGPNYLTATGAPAGFVGDAATDTTFTGSDFTPPVGSTTLDGPQGLANYFRVDHIASPGAAADALVDSSTTAVIQGKLADNPGQPFFLSTPGAAGTQAVDGGAKTFSVTVRNGGAADLKIAAASIPAGSDFSIAPGGTCASTTLNPAPRFTPAPAQATCTINVAFDPSSAGAKTATLNIPEQAAGPNHAVALTGTGTVGSLGTNPASLSFGGQTVGTSAATKSVTVSNNGGAAAGITAVGIGGANAGDFSASGCSGASLASGQSCTVDVLFTPAGTGVRTATLTISSPSGDRTVQLSGSGIAQAAAAGGGTAGGGSGGGSQILSPNSGPGKALSLKQLVMSAKIKRSKVRKQGLRVVTRLEDGTQVLRIRVYRKKSGTKTLVGQGFRAPTNAGLYRIKLADPKLRRDLSVGRYELEVTPGRNRNDLRSPSRFAFRVVR
jgi:hypothetical protein